MVRKTTLILILLAAILPSLGQAAPSNSSPLVSKLTQPNSSLGGPPSLRSGLKAIPPCHNAAKRLRPIWYKAGQTFGLRWQILAAITKIESNFGCNMGPSSAGAVGWTQFIPSTWQQWGMDADGDGRADPHNAVDAVFSSARYLRVSGAPGDYYKAIFAYNHADWYVRDVLETAKTFGNFSAQEFDNLTVLSNQGRKLRQQLTQLEEKMHTSHEELKRTRYELRGAKQRLKKTEQQLQKQGIKFRRAKQKLNSTTLEYLELVQSVSHSTDKPLNQDTTVLDYIAESSPEDAVLVYQSASSIMDQQSTIMDKLRQAALRASKLQLQIATASASQEDDLSSIRNRTIKARRLSLSTSKALALARRKLREYRKKQSQYQLQGGPGDLLNNPFGEGDYADPTSSGKLRWPVRGAIVPKFSPNRCLAGTCRPHEGVDIAVKNNTPVKASESGVVTTSGVVSGYGEYICIAHNSTLSTCYAHNSKRLARKGQRVKAGQTISLSGCTGRCFGPHVHFEVRLSGKAVDPLSYLSSS